MTFWTSAPRDRRAQVWLRVGDRAPDNVKPGRARAGRVGDYREPAAGEEFSRRRRSVIVFQKSGGSFE
jgi:hypothetical protein